MSSVLSASDGIPSVPNALLFFSSFIAFFTSDISSLCPILFSSHSLWFSTSSILSFAFVSYSSLIYSTHTFLFSSKSDVIIPFLFFIPCLLMTFVFLAVIVFTTWYISSILHSFSNSSIRSHCFCIHCSLALSVSRLSSLFIFLYCFLPSSVLTFFHCLLCSIFSSIS
uniref:Uncharacterized protein n=1 Tax=Cacopsylla melanoneura TaxID=428564 RepID=A0A8D8VTX7_9HEMI